LTSEKFFDLLLYCSSISNPVSLEHCVTHLRSDHNLAITKQSLDERFNEGAVAFVKDILRQALEVELEHIFSNDLFQQFNYVRIKDSTKFNVDNRLEKQLKGSGGYGTRKACVNIQYEFDVKTGKILDLDITSGIINDAFNAKETQYNINQGDLIIRDLGYYNLDVLASFDNKNFYNLILFFRNLLPAADLKYFSRLIASFLVSKLSKYTNLHGIKGLVEVVSPLLC